MSTAIYATLTRQHGLMQEMQVVANNLANSSTTGFKSDRAVFAEFITGAGADAPSLSIGGLAGHSFDLQPGPLTFTGGQFDLAIDGEGFFMLQTEAGPRLSRAGHFQLSPEGALVDPAGNALLDAGGGAITLPAGAQRVHVSADGTLSADGAPFAQVGLFVPRGDLQREAGTQFAAPGGFTGSAEARLVQGALENSNVSPVLEFARMVEVQRAYEAGQALMEREDERLGQLIAAVRER
jgi:flagellar basal-body rod protein FlgF